MKETKNKWKRQKTYKTGFCFFLSLQRYVLFVCSFFLNLIMIFVYLIFMHIFVGYLAMYECFYKGHESYYENWHT